MLNRIWQLTRADLRHILQSNLIWITFFLVVGGVVLGHILGDTEVKVAEALYLYNGTGDDLSAALSPALETEGFDQVGLTPDGMPASSEGNHFAWLSSEELVREAVKSVDVGFGLVIENDGAGGYRFRHLMPDLLPETTRRLTAQTTISWFESLLGTGEVPQDPPRELLPGYAIQAKPPVGRLLIPMFVFTEAFMIGLWFGAVLITGEKSRGTIDALRASPASMGEILTAKALALSIFVLAEALVTTIAVWGLFPGLGLAMLSTVLLCLAATGLAFLLSGFFRSLTGFILTGALVSLFISLPFSSLFIPSFPEFAFLPSYPMLQLLREAFFPTGQAAALWANLGLSVAWVIGLLLIGGFVYRRRLWGVSLGLGKAKEAA